MPVGKGVYVGNAVGVGKGVNVGYAKGVGKGGNVGLAVAVGKGVYVESGTKVGKGVGVGSSGVGICVGTKVGVSVGCGTTTTIYVGVGVDLADSVTDPLPTMAKATTDAMATTATVTPATIEIIRPPLPPVLGRLRTWRWATSPSLLMKNCSCRKSQKSLLAAEPLTLRCSSLRPRMTRQSRKPWRNREIARRIHRGSLAQSAWPKVWLEPERCSPGLHHQR